MLSMKSISPESMPQQLQLVINDEMPGQVKLGKIARLYANAFAGSPWNEYQVCPSGHFFGLKDRELTSCTNCSQPLKSAYPERETATYIFGELSKRNGTLITFENENGKVVGGGWGYNCTIEELASKYKTPEMRELVALRMNKTAGKVDSVFYLSEIMVDTAVRNQGLATKITKSLFERAGSLKLNLVMRTRYDSPMVRIADKQQMTRVIDPSEDTENPNRVLYIKI